ncbi:hypothetical protein Tco_1438798 [Tanacetum coccineum]
MVSNRYPSYSCMQTNSGFKSEHHSMVKMQQENDLNADAQTIKAGKSQSVVAEKCLVLHQMTSDHNRSELGIQDHSNEQSSSKLVPKDTVMLDSDESTVTYTEVSSLFEGLSNIGSPGVVGPKYEGLPWMLDDSYVQEDEVFPDEEQLLLTTASPTAQSPDYVPESDPEEVDYEDPKEDPADYPADGGDDGDDEDEPSDDDEDEDVDIEANDEEKDEHPAPADSTAIALPAADQAPSAEETELFETDKSAATPPPHPAYRVTSRISIPALVPTPIWSDAEVAILLTISTPPSSLLSPWSSPLPQIPSLPLPPILSPLPVSPPLPQIPSPPLPVSSPVPVLSLSLPASPIRPLGYRAAMIRLRAKAASNSNSLPLPPPIILSHTRPDAPSSGIPPLHLLSTDHREDRPEVTLPSRKRLGIALGPRYEIRESSSVTVVRPAGGLRADYSFVATMDREIRRDLERNVGYGIIDSWDEIVKAMQGTLVVTDVAEFSQRMTKFETRVRQDIDEVYMSDLARVEVMSLRTTVLAQQSEIRELQSADRRRQTVIIEILAMDHRRQE